ncbi:GNAT family N-acetyltransferase [candidate division GN15 bacterium]|nr:GNAT family N-acetyltransferase [candidate division GN15 bacterium]
MEYKILKADLEADGPEIVRFWDTEFHGWPVRKFDWFYRNNPAGPGDCWIIREPANNEVIGSIACFPKRMHINGKLVTVGLGGDLGVNKNYRRQGLAFKLRKAMIDNRAVAGYPFLVGTPNATSARITERAGYTVLGDFKRLVKVLHTKKYVQRIVRVGSLAGALAAPVDGLMAMGARERRYRDDETFRYEILDKFDERFDELNVEAVKQFSLIADRSSAHLNWRFLQCPYKEFRIFAMSEVSTGRLRGYIVFRNPNNELHINDYFCADNATLLEPLIGKFLLYARSEDVETVSFFFFGNQGILDTFETFGFKLRADNRIKVIVFAEENDPVRQVAYSADNWHFTNGDNDV